MKMASPGPEVGIPDLEEHLREYIERVRLGEEVVVTDGGRPVARLSPIDGPRDRLSELAAGGFVRSPIRRTRRWPSRRIEATGLVSELVAEQRR